MDHNAIFIRQKHNLLRLLPNKLLSSAPRVLNPVVNFLARQNVSPNVISTFSLLTGLGAGIFFIFKLPVLALIFIILCSVCDILDGKIAVKENRKSLYGAIYDSTMDRYAEFSIYLGIAVYFRNHWALWIVLGTILGSFMVSYTRARAEGLGIQCKIGVMQRAERFFALSLATLIGPIFHVYDQALIAALSLIALFSNITAFQRTLYVRKVEKSKKLQKEV